MVNICKDTWATWSKLKQMFYQPLAFKQNIKWNSGVTLLEGARGQGMVRCPIDEEQKIEEGNAREPCGVESRCPMKGPSGDPGAKPAKALVFFNAKTTFLTQTYIDIRLLT